MRRIKTAIIGAGKEASSLYYCFRMKPNVDIVGIADISGQGTALVDAVNDGVFISQSLEDILSVEHLDLIVETTKIPEIIEKVHRLKNPATEVIEASSLDLIISLSNKKERTEAELISLLSSVNEGIQIVDKNGIITYINKAFESLSGLSSGELIGQSIYEIFKTGPVAQVLNSGQPVSGQKCFFGNSNSELNYSVSPITVRNEIVGVIGVFRSLPDIIKLMEELQKSSSIIEGLYDRLSQINGMAELDVVDVMPIDKMEHILLKQALARYGYTVEGKKKAARALNISLATLYNKLKKYQIS